MVISLLGKKKPREAAAVPIAEAELQLCQDVISAWQAALCRIRA
jgi:hypothetical protein